MEGPTPVSALIHAATMVTAGVYMVARSAPIYAHAPNAMLVVAVVGAATALFAATIGLVQTDIKRVLAYSTVSQLGYMFLACGVGAFAAGIFHSCTHAFFKALLFLGAGSVIHALAGEQDMRKMGGLRSELPWTHLTMLVGCLAIAGIPLLAGFFSKDEILWSAYRVGGYGRARVGDRHRDRGAHRLLHVPALRADLRRQLPRPGGGGASRPRGAAPRCACRSWCSPRARRSPACVGVPAALGGAEPHRAFLEPVFAPAHHALGQVFLAPAPGRGVELALDRAERAGGVRGKRRGVALLRRGRRSCRTGWRRRSRWRTARS